MKKLLVASLMLVSPALAEDQGNLLQFYGTTSASAAISLPCALATIRADGKVSIDWTCTDKLAARYNMDDFAKKPLVTGDRETDAALAESTRMDNMMNGFAYVLKALHDGSADQR